jgi:hypothetical protein
MGGQELLARAQYCPAVEMQGPTEEAAQCGGLGASVAESVLGDDDAQLLVDGPQVFIEGPERVWREG